MTTRLLLPHEWPRLEGTELASIYPVLDPAVSRIVVVEDAGALVGCWALFPLVHVEGVWVAESHRGRASVARRLVQGMTATARDMGARAVTTAALSADVAGMLARLGAIEVPGRHFSLRVT
jgi:N-acetylglutamate synthase-like GNAT family acetyltransferase